MKSKKPLEISEKGHAILCDTCAHQYHYPEGHVEPCSVASSADLTTVPRDGMTAETCSQYINRITTKEEVHEMTQEAQRSTEQLPIQVNLAGPAQVKLGYTFTPEDGKQKHSLSLIIPVSEEDLDQVRMLTKQSGTWFVTLGVEGVQATMDEALAKEAGQSMRASPGMESRIEEAAGQKVC